MTQKFSAKVHQIIAQNSALLELVFLESVQRTINHAQTPKAKGGKLPLDTGFLRASGRTSFSGMPTGPTRGDKEGSYSSPDTVNIAGFRLGRAIFFGWTAVYARRQNLYNGFLDSAVNAWQKTVDGVVRDLRGRMK